MNNYRKEHHMAGVDHTDRGATHRQVAAVLERTAADITAAGGNSGGMAQAAADIAVTGGRMTNGTP